jgi:predicted RNase H-like HicB family nuclease
MENCARRVARCLELEIASQVKTEGEAIENLKEALALHSEPPLATRPPRA